MYRLLILLSLPVFISATCDMALACMDDGDCGGATGSCVPDPSTPPLGCCPEDTTVAGVVTTTQSASIVTAATKSSTSTCVDLINHMTGVSDCPARANLCNDSVYYQVMTEQCPKTCGRCSSNNSSSSTCVDLPNPNTGVSDCPARKAYCNNSVYQSLMKVQCPATCGFCTSG